MVCKNWKMHAQTQQPNVRSLIRVLALTCLPDPCLQFSVASLASLSTEPWSLPSLLSSPLLLPLEVSLTSSSLWLFPLASLRS